jgi:hypothetical protein
VTPLLERLLDAERVAEVDGACEVLIGAVKAVRGRQFFGAQDRQRLEQLGANLVLPAFAVRRRDERCPEALAMVSSLRSTSSSAATPLSCDTGTSWCCAVECAEATAMPMMTRKRDVRRIAGPLVLKGKHEDHEGHEGKPFMVFVFFVAFVLRF